MHFPQWSLKDYPGAKNREHRPHLTKDEAIRWVEICTLQEFVENFGTVTTPWVGEYDENAPQPCTCLNEMNTALLGALLERSEKDPQWAICWNILGSTSCAMIGRGKSRRQELTQQWIRALREQGAWKD